MNRMGKARTRHWRTTPSILLNASNHKKHKYIWFGGDLNRFRDIKLFMKSPEGGWASPVTSLGTSLSVISSYHKKNEYIWLRGGDLNGFRYLGHYESFGPGHASRSAPESGISNFKLYCKIIYQYLSYQKNQNKIPSGVREK